MWSLKSFVKGRKSDIGFGFSTTAEEIVQSLDLTDKIVLITGVSSGLGAETVRVLRNRGAHIIGLAKKPVDAVDTYIECDLSDIEQIKLAITKIAAIDKEIDVIIGNAGIMALPTFQSICGYEKQFFVNHMSHFILVNSLLSYLKSDGRVIMVASEAYRFAIKQKLQLADLTNRHDYNRWVAYGRSKLANLLFIKALAKQFQNTGRVAIAVHPGAIMTQLGRHMPNWQRKFFGSFARIGMKDVHQGAATQVFAAIHHACSSLNGEYLIDCNARPVAREISELNMVEHFWRLSETIQAECME